jgi:hypothetical protein
MAIKQPDPPWDFLRQASNSSLQSFELSRLNNAANLRREIGHLMDQWLEETAQAMLARWLLDHRDELRAPLPDETEITHSIADAMPAALPKLVRSVRGKSRAAQEGA